MPTLPTSVGEAAAALRASHPHVPALDVLDLVMQGQEGTGLDLSADWLAPGSPFGQVLAAALDRGMSPAEWAAWSRPPADAALQTAVLGAWATVVLPTFVTRYRLKA